MIFLHTIILFAVAAVAGALNSFAGGGSFISFPALVFTGVPIISANVTNKIALWPGAMSSAAAYRRELMAVSHTMLILVGVSIVGGILGALLLLNINPDTFSAMVPYLLLIATLLFIFSNRIKVWAQRRSKPAGNAAPATTTAAPPAPAPLSPTWQRIAVMAVLQFIIAIYGGFFGGGIGIMMLAMLAVTGMEHMHTMNALKNLLGSFITGISVITFVMEDIMMRLQTSEGIVAWPQAILMIIGASLGGYVGGSYARTLNPELVRRAVIVAGIVMTIIFFVRS